MSMVDATIKVSGYRILEQIYAGTRTLVYRGNRETDQNSVILKLMRSEYPSFKELVQFRNQYTIAKNLDLPGIVKPYILEPYLNGYALVMEDFGGISLTQYVTNLKAGDATSLHEFLFVAIQIAQTLDELHHQGVIHKDIKPANILINPATLKVKLIDFSIASLLPKETQPLTSPNVLEGTLAYISPEQTGRMNRGIDYRTDFYSLGVTFFELLTGQLPFTSNDPMELVHCHIAKQPPQVNTVNPDIPQILCLIIFKLMAKNAEDRYQSALGLKYDLERSLYALKETGNIAPFELEARHTCARFIISEKLYGREAEVKALLNAFDRVSREGLGSEMMLVAGFSGIGKTAVVNVVHKPIVRQRGYFIKGKFDQLGRNIPLGAFVQAFRDLMGQLLGENDAQLQEWKAKLENAVGENGQVIIDVIPELERIIGKQPPVAELSGSAATHRFNLLFQKFIQVFTTIEHPLVIFLDDLQWADSASLKLIQLLMSETDTDYLLLIGAYRDNEVSNVHPLMLMLEEIKQAEAVVNTITLASLRKSDLNNLVADTLSCAEKLAEPLTELVYQKTKGNPFFSNQFLKSLYEDGLIICNFNESYWQCDIAQVRQLALTDDVVEFMALQLQKLPKTTQEVLKLAACIGNQFDLATLAIVHEQSQAETSANLWKALQEGLILPTTKVYKFYQDEGDWGLETGELGVLSSLHYRFLHDRVQQAAYFLIPEDQKQTTHLKIGQLLLNSTSKTEQEDKIFDIVNHLNIGTELITHQALRNELAQLNLVAGRKAKASTAYGVAVGYFTMGIKLLAEDSWHQYDLTLSLYKECAEVEYLNGDFEKSEELINLCLEMARSDIEKAEVYNLLIVQYTLRAKYKEAIQAGQQALMMLKMDLPTTELNAVFEKELAEAKNNLGNQKIDSLLQAQDMSLKDKQIAIKLLKNIDPPAYFVDLELYSVIVVKSVNLSLRYGNAPESPKGYSTYGLLLGSVSGDYQSGYQFGLLALKVSERFNNLSQKAQVSVILSGFLNHWVKHIKNSHSIINDGYQAALESGELQFAGYMLIFKLLNLFHKGLELKSILAESDVCMYFCKKSKNQWAIDAILGCQILVLNLLGKTREKLSFHNEEMDDNNYIATCQLNQSFSWICTYQIIQAKILYLYGEFEAALKVNLEAEKNLKFIMGHFSVAEHNFYNSLNLAALYKVSSKLEKNEYLQKLIFNQKQMKIWADNCPANFLHKYLLVEAEINRITGKAIDAIDLYDQAIASAQKYGFIQNQALGNELAARFWLERNKAEFAQIYLKKAHNCYKIWGAKRKVEDLESQYPQWLVKTSEKSSRTISDTSTNSFGMELDISTVLKASLAISSEIVLVELIEKLMKIVIENAGAQLGFLILDQEGQLAIAAIGNAETGETVAQPSTLVTSSEHLPISVINYVAKTHKDVVLEEATKASDFAKDPYITRQKPKSVLCVPILNQGKLVAILYLENNLTTKAFTSDRLEVLKLLCSQAAISIENATLYNTLEVKVAERTLELSQALEDLLATQKKLVESEKMAALGSLVAGVAHEINTPVGTSITIASTLADETQSFIAAVEQGQLKRSALNHYLEVAKESTNLIVNNLRRAGELVQSFKQVAVDQSNLERRTFGVKQYLEEVLVSLAPNLKQTNHTLSVDGDETITIDSYPGAFAQIVTNLIVNSLTHAYQPGEKGKLCFEITQQLGGVKIQYSDDGCGIPQENLSKIFDPFFTTARNRGGSGLGLHILYNLVTQKLQGTIDVESKAGLGTIFVVALPLHISN